MESRLLAVENPTQCSIVQRINRLVVEVQVGGVSHPAWTNNTGRLHEYLAPARRGFCVPRPTPGKTNYRLFAIQEGNLAAVIDTRLQTRALERCMQSGLLPWLRGGLAFRRNVRLNMSVIDYLLTCAGRELYLEVKSAALRQGRHASYPDCPSARGRKHVRELTNHVTNAGRACMVFIAALPGVEAFQPNHSADPQLAALLLAAYAAGVEVRSVGMFYSPESSSIDLFDPDLRIEMR
jgi:sugar fermentation stimulation protein A